MTATEDLLRKPLPRRQARPWLAWGLAIFTIVILVDAVFGEAGYLARLRARGDYQRQVEQLAALRQENLRLQERYQRLDRDPAAIEAAAREDLGLLRRGEILFLVRDRRTQAGDAAASDH